MRLFKCLIEFKLQRGGVGIVVNISIIVLGIPAQESLIIVVIIVVFLIGIGGLSQTPGHIIYKVEYE